MSSIVTLRPFQATFDTTFGLAEPMLVNRRPVLAFDASTDEYAIWTLDLSNFGLGSNLSFHIYYMMASATSGNVLFNVALEGVTSGESLDLDTSSDFDLTGGGAQAVPGTAGFMKVFSFTGLANSYLQGDYLRIRVSRFASDASDTAAGDAYVLACELRDAA